VRNIVINTIGCILA